MKKRITIGLFNDSFYPMIDGVVQVVDNYARRLMKFADVIVFAPAPAKGEYDDSVFPYKVVRCKSVSNHIVDYNLPLPELDKEFKKELDKCKLDIVHVHSPATIGMIGIKYAKKHNIPLVGTMHSQSKRDFKRAVKLDSMANILNKIVVNFYDKCDECWAVNSEVGRIFHEDYGVKKIPLTMNNATDMRPLENMKLVDDLKKKYNIMEDEKVFLFVGRINALKNIYLIVDALKELKTINPKLKFKMLFVGSGQDENKLKELIERDNMQKEIIMCGRETDREKLAAYFALADLFLFPSLYDASSLVQIEAASQSTPTVFVDGAATSATVTPEVNGFISKNDPVLYAKDINRIMSDEKLYKKVSENAFKDLYKNWDDAVKEVYERYLYLIDKNEKN